jgi:hypothetical protein
VLRKLAGTRQHAAASILIPSRHPEGLDRFDKNKTAVKEKMRFPEPPSDKGL